MKNIEIELKYRITNPSQIRSKIRKLKVKKLRSGSETNEFYDRGQELFKKKMIIRLRRSGKEAWLTLKGAAITQRPVKRLEVETSVDFESTALILKTLGLKQVFRYVKKREEYKLGTAIITLDQVPKLGWFVEIEANPHKIKLIAEKLGLTENQIEDKSYLKMLCSSKKRKHIN